METYIELFALYFSAIVGFVALGIILVGLILSFLQILKLPFESKKKLHENINHIRIQLGKFLILALEFLIAKDIMLTIFDPRLEELLGLVVIIMIRVILSFFLHRELREIKLHKSGL